MLVDEHRKRWLCIWRGAHPTQQQPHELADGRSSPGEALHPIDTVAVDDEGVDAVDDDDDDALIDLVLDAGDLDITAFEQAGCNSETTTTSASSTAPINNSSSNGSGNAKTKNLVDNPWQWAQLLFGAESLPPPVTSSQLLGLSSEEAEALSPTKRCKSSGAPAAAGVGAAGAEGGSMLAQCAATAKSSYARNLTPTMVRDSRVSGASKQGE